MNFFKICFDTIKYTIDDIKMIDFKKYMKKNNEIYKRSIAEFHIKFYSRNIIRRTLITLSLFLFFPNILTLALTILGLVKSNKEWNAHIFPCLKFKKNKKEEQSQINNKKEKVHKELSKNITYKINGKEIPFEEISKEELKSQTQNNDLDNILTKNKKL